MKPHARSKFSIPLLVLTAVGLSGAFVRAPAALLGSPDRVDEVLAEGLVAFWNSKVTRLPSALEHLASYWFQWHALKTLICVFLVGVGCLLASSLWRRALEPGRRWATGATGAVMATVFALTATGLLVLNVQATAAPLVALLPLLPAEHQDPGLNQALSQMGSALADTSTAMRPAPLQVLLDAVTVSAAVFASSCAVIAVVFAAISTRCWLWRARTSEDARRNRRAFAAVGSLVGVTALGYAVVAAFGVYSLTRPAPTLLALFGVA